MKNYCSKTNFAWYIVKTLSIKKMFLFYILFTIQIYGQGSIRGSVIDSLTFNPLKGAEIILTGTEFNTISDINGEFYISGIPAGEYILQTSYLGYKQKKSLVNIKSKSTQVLKIGLLDNIKTGNEITLADQVQNQVEEINLEITSNSIKNIKPGKKLLDMPDESILLTLNRLPGVTIIYKPFMPIFPAMPSNYYFYNFLTYGGFPIQDNPVNRILIRGLDSKFANITIDGIKIPSTSIKDKNTDLSIFQEKDFQNIELNKTITADEDADATACSINLATGKAPNKRIINAELLGNYNRLDKSADQYNFTGNYCERYFDNLLGVQAGTNVEKKIFSSEFLQKNLSPELNILNISYTNSISERFGGNILFDFNTPDGGSIKFNNIFSKSLSEYFSSEAETTYIHFINTIPSNHTFNDLKREQQVFLSSIGGSNYLYGFNIDWKAAFSESKNDQPTNFTIHSIGVDPMVTASIGRTEFVANSIFNPSKGYSKEKTASIDIYKKYSISNEISDKIKFGSKYRTNSKIYDEYLYQEEGLYYNQYRKLADGSLVKKDFSGTRFAGLEKAFVNNISLSYFQDNPHRKRSVFDKYELPLISKDALQLWRQLNYSPNYVNDGADINSYNLSGSVFAGYVMNDLNFGKSVKFLTGIRIEREQNNYRGYFLNLVKYESYSFNGKSQQTKIYNYNETNLLPNFQMLLNPADFLNLRLAAYKTLIRPDYNAKMPKFFRFSPLSSNADSTSYRYLIAGNPDLKNAYVWNYEFQTQFYGKVIGELSINAFYKNIKAIQQSTNGIQLSGSSQIDSLGINLSSFPAKFPFGSTSKFVFYSFYNSPKPSRIWGFEIHHLINFRYLPGLLKNITLNYNFTFLRSETWTFKSKTMVTETVQNIITDEKQKLNNMPEFFTNVILGFHIKGLSFRISFFYQGGYPIPINYTNYQITGNEFSRLDFAAKQKILGNIFVIMNLNNITNSKEEYSYQRFPNLPGQTYQAYRYGFNFDFGFGIDI